MDAQIPDADTPQSEAPPSDSSKLFKLSVFDDKHFALKFYALDAAQFNYAHGLVMGFPERKFDRDLEAWLVPFAQATFEYLFDRFKPSEYDIDPDARIVLEYHSATARSLELREKRRWEYIFNGMVPTLPFQYHTSPFKHQVVGLDAIHQAEFFGLLMETGTGKTKVVVDELRWNAEQRVARGEGAMRVLIVCPKTVRGTWLRELAKHLPPNYPYWARRARSGLNMLKDLLEGVQAEGRLKIWVLNYDRLQQGKEAICKMRFDMIVLDESTRIKSPGAKRSRAAREVGESAERRLILTGTPIGNNVLDLWSQFQFLQPGCLGFDSFNGFKARYARVRKIQNWEKIEGWQNLDELKARMARCSFVVKKKDCLDLPPKSYALRQVEMGVQQQQLYEDMLENFIASLSEDFNPSGTAKASIILTKLLRLSQICCGFLKTMEGPEQTIPDGNVKVEALGELMEEWAPDEKFIIWCRFKYDIARVRAFLHAAKKRTVEIHGSIGERDREAAIASFNSDRGADCLIGEPQSGGEGITLLGTEGRPCTNVVYYSNDFSLLKRLQSEDRCHRIGTIRPVTYTDICCEETIDELICDRLQKKKDLAELVKDYSSIKAFLLAGRRTKEE